MPNGRQLPTLLAATLLFCTATATIAGANDDACKTVLEALGKQATTPVRLKVSIESAAAPGKQLVSEVVRLEGTMYMQLAGQWVKRPYDGVKVANDARETMEKTPHTCKHLRSEAIDGQPAELYSVQSRSPQSTSPQSTSPQSTTPQSTTESQIWISAADGLPLRQHTEVQAGGGSNRHDVRFDYKNVTPPQ